MNYEIKKEVADILSNHTQADNVKFEQLFSDIKEIRREMTAFTEAWQQARGVVTFIKWPILPFIAWRWPFTTRGGYLGCKLYGVDPIVYKNWIAEKDVYLGSQAVCLSARPFANLVKG